MKKTLSILFAILLAFSLQAKPHQVKFAIFADIHQDIMPDGEFRLKTILDAASDNKVDFVIELGDFCYPFERNRAFNNLWMNYPGEKHHVLGNHDMDGSSKDEYMSYVGQPARYYSFDKGDFHFIVLDTNFCFYKGEYIAYDHANYFGELIPHRCYMDPEQIEWLCRDLRSTDKRCLLFSHYSLDLRLKNGELVRNILEQENQRVGYKKVIAAFSGHDHSNYEVEINGIAYIQINSASNQYVGSEFACTERFTPKDNEEHSELKNTVPYTDPVYAIVSLGRKKLQIKGVKSTFIPPTPESLGVPNPFDHVPLTPSIEDYEFKY